MGVIKKGGKLARAMQKWKENEFGNYKRRIKVFKYKIQQIYMRPTFDRSILEGKNLQDQLDYLLQAEELHCLQRSRAKWTMNGNKNTKYFHLCTLNRTRKNHIHSITNSDRSLVHGKNEIATVFTQYLHNIFATSDQVQMS